MACPYLPNEQRELSEWRAWHYLGRALVLGGQGSAPWSRMMTDEELGALDARRRVALSVELKKRHGGRNPLTDHQADPIVEAAMGALGLTSPPPSAPTRRRRPRAPASGSRRDLGTKVPRPPPLDGMREAGHETREGGADGLRS